MEKIEQSQEREPKARIKIIKKHGSIQLLVLIDGRTLYDVYTNKGFTQDLFMESATKISKILKDKGISAYEIDTEVAIDPKWMSDDLGAELKKDLEAELRKVIHID